MKLESMKKGLLRQNVYLMAGRHSSVTFSPDERQEKYSALVRETTPTGIDEKIVEFDYPVTRESVKSYLSSCDYKSDPLAAVGVSPAVYGDIRDIQKVADMDMETARAMRRELLAKLSSVEKRISEKKDKEVEREDKE